MNKKLKPCPWCGNPKPELSIIVVDGKDRKWADKKDGKKWVSVGNKYISAHVYCDGCGIGVGFGTYGWGFSIKKVTESVVKQYNGRFNENT